MFGPYSTLFIYFVLDFRILQLGPIKHICKKLSNDS